MWAGSLSICLPVPPCLHVLIVFIIEKHLGSAAPGLVAQSSVWKHTLTHTHTRIWTNTLSHNGAQPVPVPGWSRKQQLTSYPSVPSRINTLSKPSSPEPLETHTSENQASCTQLVKLERRAARKLSALWLITSGFFLSLLTSLWCVTQFPSSQS